MNFSRRYLIKLPQKIISFHFRINFYQLDKDLHALLYVHLYFSTYILTIKISSQTKWLFFSPLVLSCLFLYYISFWHFQVITATWICGNIFLWWLKFFFFSERAVENVLNSIDNFLRLTSFFAFSEWSELSKFSLFFTNTLTRRS